MTKTREYRRKAMVKAIRKLSKGEPLTRAALFYKGYTKDKAFCSFVTRVITHMRSLDLVISEGGKLLADPDAMKALLKDEDAMTELIWPGFSPKPAAPVVEELPVEWPDDSTREQAVSKLADHVRLLPIASFVLNSLAFNDAAFAKRIMDDLRPDVPVLSRIDDASWLTRVARALTCAVVPSDEDEEKSTVPYEERLDFVEERILAGDTRKQIYEACQAKFGVGERSACNYVRKVTERRNSFPGYPTNAVPDQEPPEQVKEDDFVGTVKELLSVGMSRQGLLEVAEQRYGLGEDDLDEVLLRISEEEAETLSGTEATMLKLLYSITQQNEVLLQKLEAMEARMGTLEKGWEDGCLSQKSESSEHETN